MPDGDVHRWELEASLESPQAGTFPLVDARLPHWEWRTFATDFGPAEQVIAALKPLLVQESSDTYLLSPTSEAGVKIRAGLMEIKELDQITATGVERWRLTMVTPFPLTAADAARVCAALGVSAPPPGQRAFSCEELLALLAAPERAVRAVAVHKRRARYLLQGCRAEVTDVVADGITTRTLAVEGEDGARVIATVQRFGLAARENLSYPHWLRSVARL